MIVDTNVSLSRWPFRRLPGDETPALIERLRQRGVSQAWAGSFDALLHRDIGGVNARLMDECRRHGGGILTPFGAVNPRLPGWREDLRRCVEDYKMPGIRLHPNYHEYQLTDPVFSELLHAAAALGIVVQIAVSMEDTRTQHPLVRVPPVDLAALPQLAKRERAAKLALLNWWPALRRQSLQPFVEAGAVYFDIATVEGIEGIARLMDRLPPERAVFGSNFPLFSFDAALLKMQESGLAEDRKKMLFEGNARRILR
ncbi:MAG: amidohydrolase family protein [Bryobacteraceae bacterium]